jgi:hypothetical protein
MSVLLWSVMEQAVSMVVQWHWLQCQHLLPVPMSVLLYLVMEQALSLVVQWCYLQCQHLLPVLLWLFPGLHSMS